MEGLFPSSMPVNFFLSGEKLNLLAYCFDYDVWCINMFLHTSGLSLVYFTGLNITVIFDRTQEISYSAEHNAFSYQSVDLCLKSNRGWQELALWLSYESVNMCPIISKNDAEWFFRFPPYKCRTLVYCPRWHGHLMREEPWWKVRIHDERRATGLLPSPPPIWAGDQLLPPPTTCMPPMSEPASISWSHKASNFITVLAWMASKLADELTDRVDWSGNPQPLLCSLLSLQPSFLFLFLSFFFLCCCFCCWWLNSLISCLVFGIYVVLDLLQFGKVAAYGFVCLQEWIPDKK